MGCSKCPHGGFSHGRNPQPSQFVTPTALRPNKHLRLEFPAGRNHVVVRIIRTDIPWVGPTGQPKAEGRNPFGIQTPASQLLPCKNPP